MLKWRVRRLRCAIRDPGWRSDFNFRIGLPIIGTMGALVAALLISHL
jgi:hypothetical protein